ncbi:MAG: phosphoribosylformylglycinamidine synthase I [Candidatus Omnitrophica bacterium]|nr:phosphoribosylformylglycinamidine synthase I [Candidatus Omnitrophota bacterium]
MNRPKVCVLRTSGTNCDNETAFAFKKAGADVELVHVNSLVLGAKGLGGFQILALPGGFSYGDDVASGKIFANELRFKLIGQIKEFVAEGKIIIGICNGFQILVKSGLLPGRGECAREATLTINDSGKFEDRWTYLLTTSDQRLTTNCVWTKNLPPVIYLPVAHGEGKFITGDNEVLARLKKNKQIVLRYCDEAGKSSDYPANPNGSEDNIAGICDETGRILGLMPHPERHVLSTQHPRWTGQGHKGEGDGLQIFRNGVEYAKK